MDNSFTRPQGDFVLATGIVTIKTLLITQANVRALLSDFSGYVISRNMPECKNFIRDLVKEVLVFKDHIEVTFNVAFSLLKNRKGSVEVMSSIMRYDLCVRYSDSFYIKWRL